MGICIAFAVLLLLVGLLAWFTRYAWGVQEQLKQERREQKKLKRQHKTDREA